ncbi:MAG: hypothetical protein JXA33_19195 [Anaerolineae bacterium]|nr:hypothetical protein [Anaerolineae bacterium]
MDFVIPTGEDTLAVKDEGRVVCTVSHRAGTTQDNPRVLPGGPCRHRTHIVRGRGINSILEEIVRRDSFFSTGSDWASFSSRYLLWGQLT